MPNRGSRALRSRYWETEFPPLSEGKDKGATKLYTARDVKIISRIRELLYDEGFTVAGAKKRLEAEIVEGRFDGGLAPAPPIRRATQGGARARGPQSRCAGAARRRTRKTTGHHEPAPAEPSPGFDRKVVLKELKDIVKLLDRTSPSLTSCLIA